MAESDKVFSGSIPKFYDTLMVPLIFEAYAANLAALVAAFSPRSVLETAAGSGVVTRALAPRLGADARYVVTDLNQPMLDFAAIRQATEGARGHAALRVRASNSRCKRQKSNSKTPTTILVHHELSVPSKAMRVWMMPRISTPNNVPAT